MTILESTQSGEISYSDFERDRCGYILAGTWNYFINVTMRNFDFLLDPVQLKYKIVERSWVERNRAKL
jgi:hypothetical protein